MLRLLTDEQISPAVADAVRRAERGLKIVAIRDWERGHLLGAPDSLVVAEARRQGLSLVTYDVRTVPPLLRSWAEQGIDHGGVVLIDNRTIPQIDVGGLARALVELWRGRKKGTWTNRVVFLHRKRG